MVSACIKKPLMKCYTSSHYIDRPSIQVKALGCLLDEQHSIRIDRQAILISKKFFAFRFLTKYSTACQFLNRLLRLLSDSGEKFIVATNYDQKFVHTKISSRQDSFSKLPNFHFLCLQSHDFEVVSFWENHIPYWSFSNVSRFETKFSYVSNFQSIFSQCVKSTNKLVHKKSDFVQICFCKTSLFTLP